MKDRVLRYTQAKVIGGGSSINAQIYTRGNAARLRRVGQRGGCDGWAYRDVLPYFKRAENNQRFANEYHALRRPARRVEPDRPLPICEAYFRAGQELGIPFNADFNGAQPGRGRLLPADAAQRAALLGVDRPTSKPIRGAAEPDRHDRRAGARGSSSSSGRAVGVEMVDGRRRSDRSCAPSARCIVSSGAIGSPQLLMQSGHRPGGPSAAVGVDVGARPAGRRRRTCRTISTCS